jgi:hypothetical protein
MKKHRLLDTRAGYILASLGMLFGVLAPAAIPVLATAGTVNSRSIALSSSAPSATGVNYELKGNVQTAISSGGGIVVQFCDNASGPLVGLNCTMPTGMSLASASLDNTSSTPGDGTAAFTSDATHRYIKWTAGATGVAADGSVDLVFKNVVNPSAAGTFYARITTYTDATNLGTYTGDATTVGTTADQGGFALSLNNTFDVTAYVQEALTFCVSGYDSAATPTGIPDKGCGSSSLRDPSMTLGQTVGTQKVLGTTTSTGVDYAQLSTNASSGAVVNLHTSAPCGGLLRVGTTNSCDIGPQTATPLSTTNTVTDGSGRFGLTVGAGAAATGGTGTTFGNLAAAGTYSDTYYFIDYNSVTPTTAGVTGTYGSALFNSAGAPVANMNIPITFAAAAAADTPAGIYRTTMNLVATGTF